MRYLMPGAVRRGRHRFAHRRRLPVVTAGLVAAGLFLIVVVNAHLHVRTVTGGRSPASVDAAPASPTTTAADGTWAPDTEYAIGALVTYNGVAYRCRQAHRSLVTWEPPYTPALWQLLPRP